MFNSLGMQISSLPTSFSDGSIFIFEERKSRNIHCYKVFTRLVTKILIKVIHHELFGKEKRYRAELNDLVTIKE
jgi:hypothetical protein